ncbi:mitochondrial large subunit ribosomal protein-domain-containing protein [Phanerochaete sordida]|uniref:Large ribosomal subunit protein mL49 n=1 Tax=Phanerochaete sordida TaxID=48140 RepID=A0A9P3GBJ6_9APHY|nr:mitochondrial large subunit ribosomal protein-domain-containing protein [Phanerochaete sordida]
MLRSIQNQFLLPARRLRYYSQSLAAAGTETASQVTHDAPVVNPNAVRYSYFVRRNTRGSIPVYTDVRMQKHLVLIRNVEGKTEDLARDIKASLFPAGTPEAERLKVELVRGRHVVLSGGFFKSAVVQWLQSKGF